MNQSVSNVEFVAYPGEFIPQSIPFVESSVSAGFPSPADDYIDRTLDLNELLITNPPATEISSFRNYLL
jgi:DNA polymerase V